MSNKSATANNDNLYSAIWAEINLADLRNFLRLELPNIDTKEKGGSLVLPCIHGNDDSTPSFHIIPGKRFAKCFSCGTFVGNPIKLVESIRRKGYADAMVTLRTTFGVKCLPKTLVEKYTKQDAHQTNKKKAADFFRKCLVDAAEQPGDPQHFYAKPLLDWFTERGISNAVHHALPHGIMPPTLLVEQHFFGDDEFMQWFKDYFAKYIQNQNYMGSLVFFLQDLPGNITRFKIRKPRSSKDIAIVEDTYYPDTLGVYGLDAYEQILGSTDKYDTIYVCEGEFDALSSIVNHVTNADYPYIIVSLGGGSHSGADLLTNLGLSGRDHTVSVVGDNDDGGRKWTFSVLERTKKLDARVFIWPEAVKTAKDPDEFIREKGYPAWKTLLIDDAEHTFLSKYNFVYDHASEAIADIPEGDINRKVRTIQEYRQYLHSVTEVGKFVKDLSMRFSLPENSVLSEVTNAREGEEVFIQRIADAIQEEFHVVGVSAAENRKHLIHLWHKTKRKTYQIILGDERSLETNLAQVFGPVVDFIKTRVRVPTFLEVYTSEDAPINALEQLTDKCLYYIKTAILTLCRKGTDIDSAPRKSQGFHYTGESNHVFSGYLVNGNDVYKLVAAETGPAEWSRLSGPSDGQYVFEASEAERWLTSIEPGAQGLDDLRRMSETPLPLKDIYTKIHDMISSAWKLKYHETDSEFLAGYIMTLPIIGALKRQTSVVVNGEAGSGKSRLVAGLIGGNQFPDICLVEGVKALDGYTAASVRQEMNNKTLPLILDEFEDDGGNDRRSLAVRAILDMMRTVISEKPVVWTVGSASGAVRTYSLRFPLICAAVHPLNREVDMTRFISIETARPRGFHPDPIQTVLTKYGKSGVKEIRDQLAVGMFRYIPQLVRAYNEIEDFYTKNPAALPMNIIGRYKEAMYPVLAMMHVSGLDWAGFAKRFCEARDEEVSRMSTASESDTLFDSLLSTPVELTLPGEGTTSTTIRRLLGSRDTRAQINETATGVYFSEEHCLLFAHWTTATSSILTRVSKYKNGETFNPARLKMIAERHPMCVKSKVASKKYPGIANFIREKCGPGAGLTNVSLFDLRSLIGDETVASGTATTTMISESTQDVPVLDADIQI